jgi:hypothetical protein
MFHRRLLRQPEKLQAQATDEPDLMTYMVGKGGNMEYQAPEVDVIDAASGHIQTFAGPRFDGDAIGLSLMCQMPLIDGE